MGRRLIEVRKDGDGCVVPVDLKGLVECGDTQVRLTGQIVRGVVSRDGDSAKFEICEPNGKRHVCNIHGDAEVDFVRRHTVKGSTVTLIGRSQGYSWPAGDGRREAGTEICVAGLQEDLPQREPEPDPYDLRRLDRQPAQDRSFDDPYGRGSR